MRYTIKRDDADMIAIRALGFLASEPERLGQFLAVTGLGPENLRAAASDAAFLASVLDYIMADETLLVTFAGNIAVPPERIAAAQALLSGPRFDG